MPAARGRRFVSTSPDQPYRLVAIGDVGSADAYHVGDEAMLGVNLQRLRARVPTLQVSVISDAPEETASAYGVDSIPRIDFPAAADREDARAERRRSILSAAAACASTGALPPGCPGEAVIRAVSQADGVLVSGGGNLCSSWPEHLYERVVLMELAAQFHRPAVVTGQTMGPFLTHEHEGLLRNALSACRLVGCREADSLALLASMGIPADRCVLQLDDALLLPGAGLPEPAPGPDLPSTPWIAVTVHPFADPDAHPALYARLARALTQIADLSEARLVFVPHVAFPSGEGIPDRAVGEVLRRHIGDQAEFTVLEVMPYEQVAAWTAAADMAISTRYHPLVFALGGATPALGLYVDEYTRWKLRGALAPAGLETWAIPMETALGGLLADAAGELWCRRHEFKEHIVGLQPGWSAHIHAHVGQVAAALDLHPAPQAPPQPPRSTPTPHSPTPRHDWAPTAAYSDTLWAHEFRRAREATRYAQSLEAALRLKEAEAAAQAAQAARVRQSRRAWPFRRQHRPR